MDANQSRSWLARMVAARERDFKKPLKWFCSPQFFRYEKPQRGRGRDGADQRRAHLVRDRAQGVADHLQADVHVRITTSEPSHPTALPAQSAMNGSTGM